MQHLLALTVIADDRAGIVDMLATTVKDNGGNWLESNMSRLAGKFAGILLVAVVSENKDRLVHALRALAANDLRITVEVTSPVNERWNTRQDIAPAMLYVTGNDRPGIVGEISRILAAQGVNVEELTTFCDNAAMSGEPLFHLQASLSLSATHDLESLRDSLEDLSNDFIVELNQGA